MGKSKKIPEFKTYEEMGEFWDTHSLADYWDQTEPVEFQVAENVKSRFIIPLDRDLFKRVQQVAHDHGISTESMANLLIEQRLNELEPNVAHG